MHDDDMPTGSELFESDTRVGRHSFLALASTLLLGLFAGGYTHAATKTGGARDAKRHKSASAHGGQDAKLRRKGSATTKTSSAKGTGGKDMRQRKSQ